MSFFSDTYHLFSMCLEMIVVLSYSQTQHVNLPHSSELEAKWKILLADKDYLLFPVLGTKNEQK